MKVSTFVKILVISAVVLAPLGVIMPKLSFCQNVDVLLFEGPWSGEWISNKEHRDNAPVKALVQVDIRTGTASVIMFQSPTPDSSAPSYSSLSIGKIENGKIIIDTTSSGIGGGGSKMIFWLENPLVLKGTYKNDYDNGIFEFRRYSRKET